MHQLNDHHFLIYYILYRIINWPIMESMISDIFLTQFIKKYSLMNEIETHKEYFCLKNVLEL